MILRSGPEKGGFDLRRSLQGLVLTGLFLVGLLLPRAAWAHDPFETTTKVFVKPGHLEVEMVAARATLEELLGTEKVSALGTPEEQGPAPSDWYLLLSDGRPLTLRESNIKERIGGEDDGDFAFHLDFSLPPAVNRVRVQAIYLQELGPGYTGIVQVVDAQSSELLDIKVLHSSDSALEFLVPGSTVQHSPEPSGAPVTNRAAPGVAAMPFSTFLWVGIEHVVFGYDHLLFLLGVLLACLRLREILGVLTAFTLAHSVTLSLAVFDLVPLANEIVEPIIAASIAVAAFWGRSLSSRGLLLPMTFVFGLIHGLGFAAGLQALADAGNVRLLGLLSFNLGVELGQIGAALVLLPALAWCRRSLRGKGALEWTARAIGVVGATIFVWRVAGWG